MAEGGGGNDGADNPFSFKKFMKKQSSTERNRTSNQRRQEPDLFADQESAGSESTGENQRVTDSPPADVTTSSKSKKEKDDQNPFSFRKFLQGQTGGARPKTNTGQISTLDLAHDLPDFVQESPGIQKTESPLPDFAIDSKHHDDFDSTYNNITPLQNSDLDIFPSDNLTRNNDSVLQHDLIDSSLPHLDLGDHDPDNDFLCGASGLSRPALNTDDSLPLDDGIVNGIQVPDLSHAVPDLSHHGSSLPDFLPESVLGHQHSSLESEINSGDEISGTIETITTLRMQIDSLRDENKQLREELEEAKGNNDEITKRLALTREKMEESKKLEEEETAALEAAVYKVGQNLEITTERAVKAEKNVTKLEQEKLALQAKVASLQTERDSLVQGGGLADLVKEKTRYASEQLATAAKTAEGSLKDLMKGVDKLKLISDVLASVDKITEDSTEGETDNNSNNQQAKGS